MANTSYRSSMPSSTISEDRQRQRDRRRQMEQNASRANEDLPSFPEPLRVVSRQDSLSTTIQDVLGDVSAVGNVIRHNPNSWYGTSRNPSSTNQHSSSSSSHRQHSSSDKSKSRHEGSTNHKSSSGGHQSHSRSHSSLSASQSRSEGRHSTGSSGHSKGSGAYRENNSSSRNQFTASQQSDTTLRPQDQSDQGILKDSHADDASSALRTSNILEQVANRGRLQSADMPGAVEHIFQEMNHLIHEPLTAIQTPNIGAEFNFTRTDIKQKDGGTLEDVRAQGHDNNATLTPALTADVGLSDSDSSEEEEEESESEESEPEEREEETGKWDLGTYMMTEPAEDAASSAADHTSSERGKKSRSAAGARAEQHGSGHGEGASGRNSTSQNSQRKSSNRGRTSTKSSSNHRASPASGDTTKPSRTSTNTKGKNSDKRTNHSKSSSRGRHSSASSQRSSSPVPRTSVAPQQRPSGVQSAKRSKNSPLSARSQNKSSPIPRKDSPLVPSAKDHPDKHLSKAKGTESSRKADRRSEGTFPYSVNNNSNNEPSPNVRNVTVSHTQPSGEHRRTGNKRPSRVRVAEKKCSRDPPPHSAASSSESESSDEEERPASSDSSSSSSSDEEEKSVFVRSVSPLPASSGKSYSRERTNSSSAKAKYSKLNESQTSYASPDLSPVKKQTGVRSAPKSKSRRSAPEPIPRAEQLDTLCVPNRNQEFAKQNLASKDKTEHSSRKSYHFSPSEGQQEQSQAKHKPSKTSAKSPNFQDCFPSLWVRLRPESAPQRKRDSLSPPSVGDTRLAGSENEPRIDAHPHLTGVDDNTGDRFSRLPTLSTGSETEQPIRRAESVQVAVAVSSNDLSPLGSGLHSKRKHVQSSAHSAHDGQSSGSSSHKSKRRKRGTPSPAELKSSHQTEGERSRDENSQWKDRRKTSPSSQYQQQNRPYPNASDKSSSNSSSLSSNPNTQQRSSMDSTCQSTSHSASAGVASIVPEPDSSWPEQERLLKSDDYMREGKRLKHEGDACADTRTGRTRMGESLSRALIYFEAALCFVMNGYMLEMENGNERSETSSGSSHSPTSMYHQTISLLDYIKKMRPHDDQQETAFRRLNLSCLRCQALLHLRVYKLKKDLATKYSEIIADQFKQTPNKASRTPSPWHPCGPSSANGQNVVSPVSPAVPSPYGVTLPGPSPVAPTNNCEYVSSSTQVSSKITSPPNQSNVVFPPKMYEVFKHYHTIMNSLMLAHERWEQAEAIQAEHADFFRNVDTLCGRTLVLHSSLRDMATYNKVVLHQLRAVYLKSPRE
uniref:AF4/FMR2 family member lilli n=1 Tax=Phallusia mammillata TaxID=59560 RepID=A0A6F9D6I3_9ASCI|nr:AF4/FMR2 family member 4 [Phallusia mammillata]